MNPNLPAERVAVWSLEFWCQVSCFVGSKWGSEGGASIWSELIMVWKSDFMRKSSGCFCYGFALIFSLYIYCRLEVVYPVCFVVHCGGGRR